MEEARQSHIVLAKAVVDCRNLLRYASLESASKKTKAAIPERQAALIAAEEAASASRKVFMALSQDLKKGCCQGYLE